MAANGRYLYGKNASLFEEVVQQIAAAGGLRTEITSGTEAPTTLMPDSPLQALRKATEQTAEDLARKGKLTLKEEQMEEKSTVDYAEVRKKNAEKALSDYDRRMGFDDRTAQAFKKYDDQRNRLQMEANRENDKYVQMRDTADIEAMSEEERQALEQYAVNRVRDQNLPLEMQGMMPTARQEAAGLIGKYGNRADELAETFMRQENAELAQQADAAGRKLAEEKPVLASAATIPVNLMAAITGTVGQLQGAARSTGRYSTLDSNETGTALDKFSGAVREQTAQNIEGEDPNLLRKGASWLYQGGMSFADSMARLLVSGGSSGISSAIAASGAFSQGLQKYSAMGASPEQAATAATVSAGLEYITEKLPTDKVLKIFQKGGNQNAVKEVLKQAFFVEPTGEEVNLFAGMAAEALILGENSSKQQRIGDLIAGGMTKDEAEKQFWKETFQEAVNTYAVSAVAGGLGAGGAAYAGNQMQTRQDQQPTVAPAAPDATPAPPVSPPVETVQQEVKPEAAAPAPEAPAPAPVAKPQDPLQMAIESVTGPQALEQGETTEADIKLAEMRQLDAERETNKQRQKQVYEELKSARSRQNELQKQIDKAEKKLRETGKGSQARIDQLRTELEQQNNLVNQLESQNTYFTGDYERTVDEAVTRQEAVFESAREEARKAIADHAAGLITDAQLQAAQDKYNTAGHEVYRLKHMTQEQYAAELAEVGLVGDTGPKTKPEQSSAAEKQQDPLQLTIEDATRPEVQQETPQNAPVGQAPAQNPVVETPVNNVNTSASSPQTEDSKTMPAEGGQPQTVTNKGGQQVMTGFANRDFRASNTYMNSGLHSENANIRKGYRQELRKDPGAALYGVKHNADTLAEAQSRTGTAEKNAAALDDLLNKDHWTPEDVATSTLLLDQIMASGDKAAIAQMNALRQKRKEAGTYSGQVAQAFAINNPTMKGAESPATAVDSFRQILNGMKQEETTWSEKTGVPFEAWKEQLQEDVDRIGIAIATVEDGDSDSMRQIIRQIAGRRKTTAWFGTSDNLTNKAWGILKNLEFEDLKKIANTQLVAMADDYRARSKGEIVKGLRKQSMLSSLKTFTRNIAGNTVGGFADAVSESGAGRMMDVVLSKFTGKRTVGNDLARASTYAKAAKEAGQFASLCVELNIPIETDVESSYAAAAGEGSNSKYLGKTFRATGNPAMRALYAYQKYMSYALEVTDKVFEGGSNAAVAESLNRLQGANLTQEEMDSLGKFTANKRTFKNATWETTELVDGEEQKVKHGAEAARFATAVKNLGGNTKIGRAWQAYADYKMPFANVPMNVTQTGIDYTAGVAKSLGEMVSIIKDAKAGKTIPVERQRQAASDFGRGVTGTAMIGLFASAAAMGALKASNSEDWDKEALAQAEGRSGAQINWSALVRGLNGENAKWESGDVITGMDFLEPFNTQMYLGAELAQAEDINLITYAGSTIKSVWQSLMDSPTMTGLAEIEQNLNDISEAETLADQMNVVAGYAGDVASSFVPQFVRQAAQNQDGYYRDTRGDNALESAMNSFMAAIPGLSKDLPKKYSGLGEEQKRGSAVETFLDPTGTRVYEENEVTTFLDELSGRVKDKNIDIYPDRQAPMRITVAGREVALDGSMRETYQKTYGEAVNDQYRSLMGNQDFQSLSDELKAEALKAAKANAKKLAMAAVSDYKDAPAGSASQLAKEIVNKQVRSQISDLFSELDTATEYGYSTKETAAKMDTAFDAFQDLSKDTQKQILEQATGDTARYLQARQGGISTDQYLTTTQRISALGDAKQPQKLATIAKQPGLTEDQRVLLAKLYASDAQDKNIDEVKAMGYNYATYTRLYNDYENYTKGDGKRNRTIAHWQEVYGFDYKTAKALYEVFP